MRYAYQQDSLAGLEDARQTLYHAGVKAYRAAEREEGAERER